MTGSEALKMTSDEITNQLATLRSKLFKLRTQMTTEKVEDTSQFRKIRKDIARLETARRLQHAGTSGAAAAPAKAPSGKRAAGGVKKSAAKPAKAAGKAPAKKSARAAK